MALRITRADVATAWRVYTAERPDLLGTAAPEGWRHRNPRFVLLTAAGIPERVQAEIAERHRGNLRDILNRDPFRLYHEHSGVTYAAAAFIDGRATERDEGRRLRACIHEAMYAETRHDKVFYEHRRIIDAAQALAGTPRRGVEEAWDRAVKRNDVVDFEMGAVTYAAFRRHVNEEREIAAELRALNRPRDWGGLGGDVREALSEAGCATEDPSQAAAVWSAMRNQLAIITGGAGSGKSTIMKAIAALSRREAAPPRIFCVAFAARVARALTAKTGIDGDTIHRFLDARKDGSFGHGTGDKADVDLLIVEEAFMIENKLLAAILRALRPHCRVVFVGDEGQLEPIGKGSPLLAMTQSGSFPTTRLTSNHRSKPNSMIPESGRRVLRGLPPAYGDDMVGISSMSDQQTLTNLREIWTSTIEKVGTEGVQVLTPRRGTRFGATALSDFLVGRSEYAVGDRVMNLCNDRERDIFNGDVGTIVEIGAGGLTVVTDAGTAVDFRSARPAALARSLASTFHKSQGLEYRAVIIVLHPSSDSMSNRRTINMGITRARELCIAVDHRSQLMRSVGKRGGGRRTTLLREMIEGRDPTKGR